MFGGLFTSGGRKKSKKSKKSKKKKSKSRGGAKKSKKSKKSSTGKKKRPLNEYMKLSIDAKKKDLPSFTYDGKKYVKKMKGHLVYYKKA
jgi:hypothetical protein